MGTVLGTGLSGRQKERARSEIIGEKVIYLIDAHGESSSGSVRERI